MKKLISLIMCLVMIMSIAISTTGFTAVKSKKDNLAPVKLTWYVIGSWPQPGQDEVFAAANKIIEAKINATVDFKTVAFGDYDQKMQIVISSGEDYDICFTSNWANNYVQNVSKGAFLPLDDLLAKYAPNLYKNVPKVMWEATKIKGKIYGVINQQISARIPELAGPKDLMTKYKFNINNFSGKINAYTLSKLEPYIKAVTKAEPQRYFQFTIDNGGEFFGLDEINGWNVPGAISMSDKSLKVVNQFETPQVMAYAKLMREWNKKGYLNSKVLISSTPDPWAEIKAGKGSLNIGGAYKPGGVVQDEAQAGMPYASVATGTPYLTTGGIIATMHAINRNTKNPERATMLLELVNTDKELYNTLVYGIKGKNYTLGSDGYATRLGDPATQFNANTDWMWATNFLAYLQKGQPKTVWEDTKKMNATAKASPALGFNFDGEPVKAEVGKCVALCGEYKKAISLGVLDEKGYNGFLTKLRAAGSKKIMAELQKQLNAWKAGK